MDKKIGQETEIKNRAALQATRQYFNKKGSQTPGCFVVNPAIVSIRMVLKHRAVFKQPGSYELNACLNVADLQVFSGLKI